MKTLILQNRNTYIAYSTALYPHVFPSPRIESIQLSLPCEKKKKLVIFFSSFAHISRTSSNKLTCETSATQCKKKRLFFQSRENETKPHTHCPYELSNATAGTPFSVGPTRRCYLRRGGSRDLIEMSGGKRPSSGSSSAKITMIVSNWIVFVTSFRGLIIPCLLISFFCFWSQ